MSKTHAYLALAAAAASMTACTVIPKDSSQYAQAQSPVPVYTQPLNASYNGAQTAAVDPDCRRRETNRELLGGAIGGAAGAYAGEKLIGGTKVRLRALWLAALRATALATYRRIARRLPLILMHQRPVQMRFIKARRLIALHRQVMRRSAALPVQRRILVEYAY